MNYTCRDVMLPHRPTLHPAMTVAGAFAAIHHRNERYFPVVDDAGNFMGIFNSMSLVELLLPRSLTANLGREMNPPELNFMHTTVSELRERLREHYEEPITDFLMRDDLPLCTPETRLMEALYLLYRLRRSHGVVLAKGTRRYLGLVSVSSVLDSIVKG